MILCDSCSIVLSLRPILGMPWNLPLKSKISKNYLADSVVFHSCIFVLRRLAGRLAVVVEWVQGHLVYQQCLYESQKNPHSPYPKCSTQRAQSFGYLYPENHSELSYSIHLCRTHFVLSKHWSPLKSHMDIITFPLLLVSPPFIFSLYHHSLTINWDPPILTCFGSWAKWQLLG